MRGGNPNSNPWLTSYYNSYSMSNIYIFNWLKDTPTWKREHCSRNQGLACNPIQKNKNNNLTSG